MNDERTQNSHIKVCSCQCEISCKLYHAKMKVAASPQFKLHLIDAITPEIMNFFSWPIPWWNLFHKSLDFKVKIHVNPFTHCIISLNCLFFRIISMTMPRLFNFTQTYMFHWDRGVHRESVVTLARYRGAEAFHTAYLRALVGALLVSVVISLIFYVTRYEMYLNVSFYEVSCTLGWYTNPILSRIRTSKLNNGNWKDGKWFYIWNQIWFLH
jgi:hypothetical protein